MDEPKQLAADGRSRRLFVRHTGHGWLLITEWSTYGTYEKREEESALPGGIEGKPDAEQIRAWMDQLYDRDEEVVFRAALALGAHGVQEAVRRLSTLLVPHLSIESPFDLLEPEPPPPSPAELQRRQLGHHAALAAAIALGQIQSADAIRFLMGDGLEYRHVLVLTAVREALHKLTGHEIMISEDPPEHLFGESLEDWIVRRLHEEWDKWWRENEDAVRARLAKETQPVSPPRNPRSATGTRTK